MAVSYVSVHLPKSGGTSIRTSLEAQFGEHALFDYGRGPLGPRALDPALPIASSITLIHGHFRPARYTDQTSAFWFTFLREPVDLLISFYHFWQGLEPHAQPLHDRFLRERPSIEAFAAWPPIRHLSSRTFFGDFDMGRFDHIGFHETRHNDIEVLNRIGGLRIDASRHENRTQGDPDRRQAVEDDAALRSRLRDLLRDDIDFYEGLRRARA